MMDLTGGTGTGMDNTDRPGRFTTTDPKWSKLMATWTSRLDKAMKKRSKWSDEAAVSMDMISGRQWDEEEIIAFGAPITQADILSSSLEIMTATIVTQDPRAIVFPKQGNFEDAQVVQALLNYWYREMALKSTVKDWVQATLALSQGYVKMGVSDSKPWVTIVDPRNMLLDPRGYDPILRDCKWTAERQILDFDEIIDDDKTYPPALKEGLQANLMLDPERDGDEKTVLIWECYDKTKNMMYVLAEGHDKPLREEKYDFKMWEQYPYERLVFRYRPFTLYPQSDIIALFTLQKSLNKLLSTIVDHAQRHKTIWLTHESVSDKTKARIANAAHGDMVSVADMQSVRAETIATLSGEIITALQQVLGMIREQTGISDYLRGSAVRNVQSATEAAVISQGDQLRLGERRETLEVGLRNIGRFVYKLLRTSVKKDVLIEIDPRTSRWEKVSPSVLAGEYDIQIETGFVSPLDKSIEVGRQQDVLQALTPFIEAGIVKIRPMLSELLKKMGNDPDEYLITDEEADQAAQAQQQLEQMTAEMEQMAAQIAQVEEMIQNGDLQLTTGPDATAVPISELKEEADEMVAARGDVDGGVEGDVDVEIEGDVDINPLEQE